MPRTKSVFMMATAPVVFCVSLLYVASLPPEPGVTRSNFNRVTIGMVKADVESIFGGPANNTAPNGRDWRILMAR